MADMRLMQGSSIKRKLMLINLLTSMAVLLLASMVLIIDELIAFRRSLVDDLRAQARIIGSNSTAALVFNDQKAAEETLSALSNAPNIVYAIIYTKDGRVFAKYFRKDVKGDLLPPKPQENGHHFGIDHLTLFQRIVLDGETIGTIYIQSDLKELYSRLIWYGSIVIIVMVASLLFAFLLLSKLQQAITKPILDLVRLMRTISQGKDYSVRAVIHSQDELGSLAEGFNEMLTQIQKRDTELELHREHLEELIAERTTELARANEQLELELIKRRKVEESLRQAKEAADTANRAKSEFLATMSHEIRTPMNAIIGMADLLWETPLTPEQQKYVHIFRRAGENLLSLINDILDLSKVEAGRLELENINFDLEEVVGKTSEMLAMHAHGKGLELAYRISPDVPTLLVGDPNRLRQVLINLMGNAIKFTEKGEVVLRVENEHQVKDSLLFSVSDTGIGILPEKLDTIFKSFTQADSSTTRQYGGTGLGLTISKRLVELMGGRIWVESKVGQGSTFYFTARFGLQPESRRFMSSVDMKEIRTLIVDDNATSRSILREMLIGWGAKVTELGKGEQIFTELERAKKVSEPYRLLLLDSSMPGMDGFQVAEHMKGNPGIATIMMLTSDNYSENITKVRELGIAGYVVKPVNQSTLVDTIATALNYTKVVPGEQLPVARPAPSEDHRSLRILLVEDFEDNRLLIQSYLKKMPYQIDIAENGEIAVEKFKSGSYDLVLMDMQMPVMDGYAATREIRKWERERGVEPTCIIALTASAFKEDTQRSLDAGCTAHITKPIKKATLLETIKKYARGESHDTK